MNANSTDSVVIDMIVVNLFALTIIIINHVYQVFRKGKVLRNVGMFTLLSYLPILAYGLTINTKYVRILGTYSAIFFSCLYVLMLIYLIYILLKHVDRSYVKFLVFTFLVLLINSITIVLLGY